MRQEQSRIYPMNSRQVLRVIHGAWNLHQNGEWSFERKTNDLGFPAIVRTLPEWMLIPDGSKTPPITILQTLDVQVMMAVRAWFADLALFVTIGAEDVARYQFFCRADFNIGSSSYKFGNGNEDPSFEGLKNGNKRSMNSRQVLRVIHGAWNLHQNGEWSFERKTNDLGFPAIVRTLPEWMLIPDGSKTPPITILQTLDVQVMMAVRAWFADLALFVTIGAEDVARYQFFCRADFNIGSSSYKFGNGNEDPSFEDDTDSDGDGTEPLGSNKLSITVFNTDVALDSEYIPQPNVSNDSPMEYYKGIPVQFAVDEDFVIVQPSSPPIDDGISFWEGVIASENDNDVKDEEHSDEMDLDIPMAPSTLIMPTRVLADTLVIYNGETMLQNSASVDLIPATNNSPSISATVGLIPNPANADDNLVINLDYSSSEDSMDSGVF
ncbi:hypothetical protein DY000_02023365 [Brassica cretica]|uniref:Uncharacterized protein n=1 Tax=Brassica cretica TaxID=69181 RepID=A0ABQ7E8R9_BRACR|nr:hypothetical protein DY000_02023365 [Brassica cretica]